VVQFDAPASVCRAPGTAARAWLVGLALVSVATRATGQASDAIVKVVSTIAGKSYEGIGFVYQPVNAPKAYVVTALHLVAGSAKIEIQTAEEEKLSGARIFKFFRSADLALLEPATPLRITPLRLHSGAVPSAGKVWSISQQRVASTEMRIGKEKALFDLFKREKTPLTPQEVNRHFDPHFYPDARAQVLELDTPIGPGDSGSPITYNDAVVSMVDGGLQNLGGIKKAWWSIPLKRNLDVLWAQGETDATRVLPYSGAGGRILFSKPRGDNQPVKYGKGDEEAAGFSLYHTDEVEFGDVYATMLPEDRQFIKQVIDDDDQITLDELSPETIDVYEDYRTGATFAIPAMLSDDLQVERDAGHTFVDAFSRFSEHSQSYVKLIVWIDAGGVEAKDAFKRYILSGDALNDDDWGGEAWHDLVWGKDEGSDDDVVDELDDEDDPYYHEIMERTYTHEHTGGEVYASMTIDEAGSFLGVAIIVNDPASLKGDDLINYYLMEACMTMAGFPYD